MRANPRAFLADDCDPKQMFHEQTSGTTGKPLDIWRTKDTVSSIQAIADARTRMWGGIPRDSRWARLGGQLVIPIKQRRPPFWVWNAAMRQLYLSSFHLAPDLIPYYLDALARYPLWLAGQDYDHGTGHGVGVYLSVHEGPQRLSRLSDVPLTNAIYRLARSLDGIQREGRVWTGDFEKLGEPSAAA